MIGRYEYCIHDYLGCIVREPRMPREAKASFLEGLEEFCFEPGKIGFIPIEADTWRRLNATDEWLRYPEEIVIDFLILYVEGFGKKKNEGRKCLDRAQEKNRNIRVCFLKEGKDLYRLSIQPGKDYVLEEFSPESIGFRKIEKIPCGFIESMETATAEDVLDAIAEAIEKAVKI